MYHIVKYALDFCLALCLLVILSPIFLIIAVLLLLQMKDGVFFKQQRPGYHGRIFNIYKFKTMRDLYLENGVLAPDEDRLTKLGLFLRKSSLDELPSLLNIIKGEMSFVGPRPLLVEYLPLYSEEQARRHDVRPGLTGWAQVNGRNAISWEEKFKLDLWYINHESFCLDFKIILLTLKKVFKRSNIQADNHVSMPKFTGSGSASIQKITSVEGEKEGNRD